MFSTQRGLELMVGELEGLASSTISGCLSSDAEEGITRSQTGVSLARDQEFVVL